MWDTNPALGLESVTCGAQNHPCIWTGCHVGHKPRPGVGSSSMWGTNPDLHMDLVPCGAQAHPWGWTRCPLRVLSKPNLFHPLLSAHPDSLCSQWRKLAQPPPQCIPTPSHAVTLSSSHLEGRCLKAHLEGSLSSIAFPGCAHLSILHHHQIDLKPWAPHPASFLRSHAAR